MKPLYLNNRQLYVYKQTDKKMQWAEEMAAPENRLVSSIRKRLEDSWKQKYIISSRNIGILVLKRTTMRARSPYSETEDKIKTTPIFMDHRSSKVPHR